MSALVVVVLSAVYTKRAIDRRLASVHVEEEVQVEEQHYLLGSSSSSHGEEESQAGVPAGGEGCAGRAHRGVMVSVETPVLVRRASSAEQPASGRLVQQQQQQPLRTLGGTSSSSSQPSWGSGVAVKLGFGWAGGRKLKVSEDLESDAAVPLHSGSPPGAGDCEGSCGGGASKAMRVNRNGH